MNRNKAAIFVSLYICLPSLLENVLSKQVCNEEVDFKIW